MCVSVCISPPQIRGACPVGSERVTSATERLGTSGRQLSQTHYNHQSIIVIHRLRPARTGRDGRRDRPGRGPSGVARDDAMFGFHPIGFASSEAELPLGVPSGVPAAQVASGPDSGRVDGGTIVSRVGRETM